MTRKREAFERRALLEDAFTRAEGSQEVYFRGYQKAVRAKRQALIAEWVARGKAAHRSLVQAALDLSTMKKDAGK